MDDIFAALLAEFEDAGLWKDGVELIGSWSFLLYQRHLGMRKLPVRTQAASAPDGSTYFLHPVLKLEFIVPERGKGDSDSPRVAALGIRAISNRPFTYWIR